MHKALSANAWNAICHRGEGEGLWEDGAAKTCIGNETGPQLA
jgi:hypothetical protein